MAANSVITVTGLDYDNIRSDLKSFLSSKSQFADYNFEGSTISMILDLLAYNTYRKAFVASMVGNEGYLDSAQLRDSVVSRAKGIGYTPRSAQSAYASLAVTIDPDDSPTSITIAKGTQFTAAVDGKTYIFSTPTVYTVNANADGVYSTDIEIAEGRVLTHRFPVTTLNPVRYILPNENVDTRSLAVTIQQSLSDTDSETFTLADDITEVTANSAVFFLQEATDKQYEIFFGDGVIGKQPQVGNIVIVEYRVCAGEDANDIDSFTSPSTLGGYSDFDVEVTAASSGGAAQESIDSIRFNAPRNWEAQNRAVTAEDYKRIILRDNGDIDSVSVWGGEDNTPAIYGKVYIAVKPASGTVVSDDRKNLIKGNLKKYNVMSIDPEFVDASYLYVKPTVRTTYDPALTTLSATAIQQKVLTAVESFEANNLGTFESTSRKFRYSKFLRALDSADNSIVSTQITLELEKRFTPLNATVATYNIAFNNSIRKPADVGYVVTGQRNLRSSAFTYAGRTCYFDDDGEGNVRIFYYGALGEETYVNTSIGTIDYMSGLITLNSFAPTSISGSYISLYVTPKNSDVAAVRNQILLLAGATVTVIDERSSAVVAVTRAATTQGVSVNVVSTGINTVVI